MEEKKSHKADLESRRLTGFLLGLVVALSVLVAALEFTTGGGSLQEASDVLDDVSQDLEMMPAMRSKDMIAAEPRAASRPSGKKLNVVDKDVVSVAEEIHGDGKDDSASGSTSSGDSSREEASALSPVAVDDNSNPLNFQVVERLPEFPGGMVEFMKWLTKNLTYPAIAQQQKLQGRVMVAFIINKDGSITNARIVKSVCPELDREALRIVRIMPKWKPGEQDGKPCRTYFCIPVVFKI